MLSLPELNFFEMLPPPLAADTSELNETTENFAVILSNISVLLQPPRADAPTAEPEPAGDFAAETFAVEPADVVSPTPPNAAAFAELQALMRQLAPVKTVAVPAFLKTGAGGNETVDSTAPIDFDAASNAADQLFAADQTAPTEAKDVAFDGATLPPLAAETGPVPSLPLKKIKAEAVSSRLADKKLLFTTETPETDGSKQIIGGDKAAAAALFEQIPTARPEKVEIKLTTLKTIVDKPGRSISLDRFSAAAATIDAGAPPVRPEQAAIVTIGEILSFDETSAAANAPKYAAPSAPVIVPENTQPNVETATLQIETARPTEVDAATPVFDETKPTGGAAVAASLFQADETSEKILWGAKRLIAEPTFRRLTRIKLPDEVEPVPPLKTKPAPTGTGETPPIIILNEAPAPHASETGIDGAMVDVAETIDAAAPPPPIQMRPNGDLWQPSTIETPPIFDREKIAPHAWRGKPPFDGQTRTSAPVKLEINSTPLGAIETAAAPTTGKQTPIETVRFEAPPPMSGTKPPPVSLENFVRQNPSAPRAVDNLTETTIAAAADPAVAPALKQTETLETPPIFVDSKIETAEKKAKSFDRLIGVDWRPEQKVEPGTIAPVEQPATVELDQTDVARQIEPRLAELAAEVERKDEKQILRMRLHPAELGTVEIKLERGADGLLEAEFVTENSEAQAALNQGVEKLREALEQSGWQIARIDVTSDAAAAHGGQYGDRRRQDEREPPFGRALAGNETGRDEKSSADSDRSGERLVSLHA